MSFGGKIIIGKLNSIANGCGYLFSDNRCSGHGLQEADITCCNHCQKILYLKTWRDDGGWCGQCSQPVCSQCADEMVKSPEDGGGCRPFIKQVEENLNKAYHESQVRRMLGL